MCLIFCFLRQVHDCGVLGRNNYRSRNISADANFSGTAGQRRRCRGVKTGVGVLAALLPANAVQTAPIVLATTLASAGASTGTVAAMNLATNAGMS
jgi:hypothetical protein